MISDRGTAGIVAVRESPWVCLFRLEIEDRPLLPVYDLSISLIYCTIGIGVHDRSENGFTY